MSISLQLTISTLRAIIRSASCDMHLGFLIFFGVKQNHDDKALKTCRMSNGSFKSKLGHKPKFTIILKKSEKFLNSYFPPVPNPTEESKPM